MNIEELRALLRLEPPPGDADALRARLVDLTSLLIECDEPRWASRLGGLVGDLQPAASDADRQQVVRSVLGLYGGMGSFSDVVLQDASGVLPEQNHFDSLRADLFELARRELH